MKKFISTLSKLFWIARPISWPNTAYPFATGYILSGGAVDLTFVFGTLYFLGPYNLLMYGINDVFDYESDIRNPRKGGIEGMREQRSFHPTIVNAALITNVPFVAYFLAVGTPLSRIVFAVVIAAVLAYSVAVLRFKERPFIDSMTSSTHFVGPLMFALALLNNIEQALPYVVAFFLWGMASHAFGAVQDIIPDRAGGLKSIATVIGARGTVWFSMALYLMAVVIFVIQGSHAYIIGISGLAYVANLAPYISITDETSGESNPAWRRFIWLNYLVGFVITMQLIVIYLS